MALPEGKNRLHINRINPHNNDGFRILATDALSQMGISPDDLFLMSRDQIVDLQPVIPESGELQQRVRTGLDNLTD